MAGDRYVVLGLAQARSTWFRAVSQWATAASINAEFIKCVSAEELRARLSTNRPFSAVLVDGALPALDRDLVDTAHGTGCAVIVIDDRRTRRDWSALGVQDVLPEFFDRKTLLDSLAANAVMIGGSDSLPGDQELVAPAGLRGRVAMVCGSGGAGTSTVAIALAQGVADDPRDAGHVLLADLALHAEQAMLHDARDVAPGVSELVDAYRAGRPSGDLRSFAYRVDERRYDLLLGLRQARGWAALRRRAVEAALDALQGEYRAVICDSDADLEGEDEGGSIEVEERHVLARAVAARADVVFAVAMPSMKGLGSLVRVIGDLRAFGVPVERIVPVFNRASGRARARGELAAALGGLVTGGGATRSPVFLPDRRVDEALRDGVRLKMDMTAPLARAFREAVPLGRTRVAFADAQPVAIAAGTLGLHGDAGDDDHSDGGLTR